MNSGIHDIEMEYIICIYISIQICWYWNLRLYYCPPLKGTDSTEKMTEVYLSDASMNIIQFLLVYYYKRFYELYLFHWTTALFGIFNEDEAYDSFLHKTLNLFNIQSRFEGSLDLFFEISHNEENTTQPYM